MKSKVKNRVLWAAAVVITLALVIYQRTTGPTTPVKGTVEIAGETVNYKFLRTFVVENNAPVELKVENKDVKGVFTFKRYKSYDEWKSLEMEREGDMLKAQIPHQPPAGKVEYKVELIYRDEVIQLTEEAVILRYKGAVPDAVLIPHIFLMFFSMLFGLRAGLEALFKGDNNRLYVSVVLVTLLIGGLILGPVVQKYAFGEYWTGWPFGHDLTDNKTAFIFIFWLIAWFMVRKNQLHRTMVLVATVFMIAVYIIPHSALGSEIDHTKAEEQNTENVTNN
ncbi:MAG: hypothetical protein ABFS32_16540 [Bacteroidota bacterium]